MPNKSALIRLFSLLFAGGACAAQTSQSYRIVDTVAAGDVAEVNSTYDLDAALTAESNSSTQPIPYKSHEVARYLNQTLAQSKGRIDRERRQYSAFQTRDAQEKPRNYLQGKTVLLERSGKQVKITCENGTLSKEGRERLKNALNGGSIIPDRKLAVGDEWTPDSSAIEKVFDGMKDPIVQCKLTEVTQVAGHPCAHVHYTVSGETALDATTTMQIEAQCDNYYAIDLQRPLAEAMSGSVTFHGEKAVSGETYQLSGSGTISVREWMRWKKVAGKPVNISGETLLQKSDTK